MPDLIAYGPEQRYQWRKTLPAGTVTLGRDPARSTWAADWDRQVSGLHAELVWRDGQLRVRQVLPRGEAEDLLLLGTQLAQRGHHLGQIGALLGRRRRELTQA